MQADDNFQTSEMTEEISQDLRKRVIVGLRIRVDLYDYILTILSYGNHIHTLQDDKIIRIPFLL